MHNRHSHTHTSPKNTTHCRQSLQPGDMCVVEHVINWEPYLLVRTTLHHRRPLRRRHVFTQASPWPMCSQAANERDMRTLWQRLSRYVHFGPSPQRPENALGAIQDSGIWHQDIPAEPILSGTAGGRWPQGLLTSPLSPSTNSSVTGYAESASGITISSTSTRREVENPDMSWSQDTSLYFGQTPPSTTGLVATDQSVLSLQTVNWDQVPTEQDIRDLLQMPDEVMTGH